MLVNTPTTHTHTHTLILVCVCVLFHGCLLIAIVTQEVFALLLMVMLEIAIEINNN